MKTLKTWQITIAALLFSISANAYDFEVDGIYYNHIGSNMVEVTYKGIGGSTSSMSNSYSGDIKIPDVVMYSGYEYCVTRIGYGAFYNCKGLKSLTIPNSVVSIEKAFSNCTGLTSVHITDISAWCNINFEGGSSNPLLYAKHLYMNGEELNNITIPNNVTSIGSYAFYNYTGLTSVTIPNSVTSIGDYAFYNCTGLTSVTIPNSVTSIGDYAFYNCTGMPITDNIRYADSYLIEATDKSLEEYNIKEGTRFIGSKAFYNCSNLTSISIPNSVTSIGIKAFSNCSSLPIIDNIRYADWYLIEATDKSLEEYNIKEGTRFIGSEAFYECSKLISISIPNSVTSIGIDAFSHSSLKSVTLPNSVTNLGKYAFWGCDSLTSVNLGNSVKSIGAETFKNCYKLASVTIPQSVTNIGNQAFYGCSVLTSVTIPQSVTSIGDEAFDGCKGLTSVHITDISAWCNINFESADSNPLIYAKHLYINGEELNNITIPNSVTSIGNYAFYNCTGLTSVTIPNSVTSIGNCAFDNCTGLTSVTIPNSVTYIGSSAFYNCSGLTSVTIPNSVTSIGNYAFYNCTGLTSVTIPNSVTSIGNHAFYNCTGLTSVTIPNSVTSIEYYAFYNCTGLTSVTIPNSVTSIEYCAFYNCSGLTSVTIPNSVTSIGNSAFFDTKLQTIVCKSFNFPSLENSKIFSTNEYNHTQVYVPEGSYWNYAFSDWGNFIHIKEMVTETENLDSHKAYMIADASGRNYTVYDDTKKQLVNIAYTHALDEKSEGSCWTVLNEGNASYLYNIGAKKYGVVAENGILSLSDTPVNVNIRNTENGLSVNGNTRMFVLNNNINFDTTSISELKAENGKEKPEIYDLSGRRITNIQKGIYIQNGNKVIR